MSYIECKRFLFRNQGEKEIIYNKYYLYRKDERNYKKDQGFRSKTKSEPIPLHTDNLPKSLYIAFIHPIKTLLRPTLCLAQ